MRVRLKKIFFTLIVIAFIFLFLELSMRLMYVLKYKDTGYLSWGFRQSLYLRNGYFKIDNYHSNYFDKTPHEEMHYGFRTGEFNLKKPDDVYRIVALGGSSVYGTFYLSYKDVFPYMLEQRLNRDVKGKRFEVINAGVPGQTTYGVYSLLRHEIFDMEPDLVIIYSLWNHFQMDSPALFNASKEMDWLYQKLFSGLGDKSLLAYFFLNKIGTTSFLTTDKITSYRKILENIILECRQKNAELLIVKQLAGSRGTFASVEGKNLTNVAAMSVDNYKKALGVIDDLQKEHNTMVLDFSTYSAHCKDRLDEFLADDVHPRRECYNLLAELLHEKLIDSGISEIREN